MRFSGFDSVKGPGEFSGRPPKKHFNRIRNLIMLLTMYMLGLSTKEIVSLRWQDLDLISGRFLLRKGPHGLKEEYTLDQDLLDILKRWRAYQARATYYKALEYVFTDYEGAPMSRLYLYALQFFWVFNTFIPVNLIPDIPKNSRF